MLEDYKEFLERELKAVEERIRALRKVLEGGG